jgi:lipopolysaccharide export system permease protein
VTFGILQRYVLAEVVRSFLLAVLAMTIIFVLFMVMAEAAKLGLSPRDIMTLVPYVVPSTLPFTVPVSMLFAVTVVFGRLASDNEIIAIKTAGRSAWTVVWPAVLTSAVLSGALMFLSAGFIPESTHQAKLAIFKNFEDAFYKWLKVDREFNNPGWPFLIKVQDVDVETRWMYQATFKHRAKEAGAQSTFDLVVTAKRARINFDMKAGFARVYLDGASVTGGSESKDVILINDREIEMEVPDKNNTGYEKRIQEWTSPDMVKEQSRLRKLISQERKRQAVGAALMMGSGRLERVDWRHVQASFVDYTEWNNRLSIFETEKHFRIAQSFGSLVFVLLGAPVGILFARRDFLSAFISCFLPIILLYYPLMLLGVNLSKEGVLNPVPALWSGNMLLALLAGFVTPPIIKH